MQATPCPDDDHLPAAHETHVLLVREAPMIVITLVVGDNDDVDVDDKDDDDSIMMLMIECIER